MKAVTSAMTQGATVAKAIQLLQGAPRRKVGPVVRSGGPFADAVLEVAFATRPLWNLREVELVLAELEICDAPIGEWLQAAINSVPER